MADAQQLVAAAAAAAATAETLIQSSSRTSTASAQPSSLGARLSHLGQTMNECRDRFGSTSPLAVDKYLKATSEMAWQEQHEQRRRQRQAEISVQEKDCLSEEGNDDTLHQYRMFAALSDSGDAAKSGSGDESKSEKGDIHDITTLVAALTTRASSPTRFQGGLPGRGNIATTHFKHKQQMSWRPSREAELEQVIEKLLETTVDRGYHENKVSELKSEIEKRQESFLRRSAMLSAEKDAMQVELDAMHARLKHLQDDVRAEESCSGFTRTVKDLHAEVMSKVDEIGDRKLAFFQHRDAEKIFDVETKLREIGRDVAAWKDRGGSSDTDRGGDVQEKVKMLRSELEAAHSIAARLDALYKESSSENKKLKLRIALVEEERDLSVLRSVQARKGAENMRRRLCEGAHVMSRSNPGSRMGAPREYVDGGENDIDAVNAIEKTEKMQHSTQPRRKMARPMSASVVVGRKNFTSNVESPALRDVRPVRRTGARPATATGTRTRIPAPRPPSSRGPKEGWKMYV